MRMGWSSAELVKFIQIESKELVTLSTGYVRKMLDDLRRAIPPAELMMTTQNTMVAMNAANKVSIGLNELDELNKLYEMQMNRIKIDVDNETKINKLFQTTGREIFYAMKILKQSSDLKMDLGIAKRQLGEVAVTATSGIQISDRYNDGIGKVMTDPDSRRKVLGMVETLMSLGARASLDASEIINSAAAVSDDIDVIDVDSSEAESESEPEEGS